MGGAQDGETQDEGRVAPRVLLVMAEQWPRALLRASLRELGYDAVGAPDCGEALVYPVEEEGRGPVRLIVIDAEVLRAKGTDMFRRLRRQHGDPAAILLAEAVIEPPSGDWAEVLRRPLQIGDIISAVQRVLPIDPA